MIYGIIRSSIRLHDAIIFAALSTLPMAHAGGGLNDKTPQQSRWSEQVSCGAMFS
jgi:hypothetical protein